jgi:hypothetical protein
MDTLLQREAHFTLSTQPPCLSDRRLAMVEDIRTFICKVYPDEDEGDISGDYHELFARSVACLDRVLATPMAEAFTRRRAFPAACFLLASKFVKTDFMRISDTARLCGVGRDEMTKVELFVFFQAGLNLFGVTARDFLAGVMGDIPEEHVPPLAKRLLASLYRLPHTDHPPSVVAAALLHATLPGALLRLDADTGLSRFLLSMVGRREAVLALAGVLEQI